jgi:DNA polymerase/3'-5' exonuclease PolX
VISRIAHLCDSVTIAGEFRRGVANVRSMDVVLEPRDLSDYRARLDYLYLSHFFAREVDNKQQPIWEDYHRAIVYQDLRIDLHVCDLNNRGYLLWLHTESMSNRAYVKSMLYKRPQMTITDDYLYHADKLLRIPTEELFFRLIGIEYITPTMRNRETYARYSVTRQTQPIDINILYAPRPTQLDQPSLFD